MKIKEMQIEIVKMIKDVDLLFKENNIQYFLLGGSVLGAIRHKGFIPWDDDMDIAVFRSDFKKVENLLSSMEKYVYEFSDNHIVPDAPMGHLHYVNEQYPIENSPTIDVFALDGAGQTEREWKKQRRIANWYHLAVLQRPAQNRGLIKKFITFVLLACIPKFLWKKIEFYSLMKIQKYDVKNAPCITNLFGAWGYKEFFTRSMFDSYVVGEFEGLLLPLPANPHEYLSQMYGDYMQLPPLEERKPRHRTF